MKLYLKLPGWLTVSTTVGEYNPDWSIVMEKRNAHGHPTGKPFLCLVRETMAENWRTGLRQNEQRKIPCDEQRCNGGLGVEYKVVLEASELL